MAETTVRSRRLEEPIVAETMVKSRWLDGAVYITTSPEQAVFWFTGITGWAPTAENVQFDGEHGLFRVQISYDNPPPVTSSYEQTRRHGAL